MNIDTLNPLVDLAFRMAKSSLEKHGSVQAFFVLHFPDDHTEELHIPPEAQKLMNSFRAKETIFRMVRMIAESREADAVIMASEMWQGQTTEAAAALPREELDRLLSERAYQTGVDLGLIERHEIVSVQVQTAEQMRMVSQRFRRHREQRRIEYYDDRTEQTCLQTEFSGTTKMFGDLHPIRPEAEALLAGFFTRKADGS